jgi:hypothetical protein
VSKTPRAGYVISVAITERPDEERDRGIDPTTGKAHELAERPALTVELLPSVDVLVAAVQAELDKTFGPFTELGGHYVATVTADERGLS